MATSLTSLALDIASKEAVTAVRTAIAPLTKFAKSFAEAQGEVGDTVKVPVFARGTAAEFAAGTNDYVSATTAGVGGVAINLNKHPWFSRRLLPDDVMETNVGKDWVSQVTVVAAESVAKYMVAEPLTGILKDTASANTAGHVSTTTISGSDALAKVKNLRKAAIAKGVNPANAALLLPSDLYSDLLEKLPFNALGSQDALVKGYVETLFGFGFIAELQDAVTYTNASSKLVTLDAMIVPYDALAIATRLPVVQNSDLYEVSDIVVPELGGGSSASIRIRSTGSNALDAKFLGAEVIFGWKMLQPEKIVVASTTAA